MNEIARMPVARIIWNDQDATIDLKPFLSSVTFTNHEEGASDDVEITLDNGDGLWSGAQYPSEGDTMQFYLGYLDKLIDCGMFQIDELTLSGPPHLIEIKTISSFVSKSLQTKNSKTFESQTLKQIAQFFCKKHDLKLIDSSAKTVTNTSSKIPYFDEGKELFDISNSIYQKIKDSDRVGVLIVLDSYKQDLVTIAKTVYGYSKTYSQSILYFTNIMKGSSISSPSSLSIPLADANFMANANNYVKIIREIGIKLTNMPPVVSTNTYSEGLLDQINLDQQTQEEETDLFFLSKIAKEYGFLFSIKGDKLTFMTYYDLDNAPAIRDISINQLGNYSITEKTYDTYASGFLAKRNSRQNKLIKAEYSDVLNSNNSNSLLVTGHVSDTKQAEQRIKGRLWDKNKSKQSGTLNDLEGDPSLVAGMNINLTGFGNASGKYHIVNAVHKITGDSAYTTSLEIRLTGSVPKPQRVPPKKVEKSEYDGNKYDAEENQ
jgi:phage protein D